MSTSGRALHGHVYLRGPLTIGEACQLYPFVCIGFPPQHRSFDPTADGAGVAVGDRNTFREGATVHRAMNDRPTRIGHDCLCMANAHVGHDAVLGDRVTVTQTAVIGGHAEVGDDATLGGNAAIHQFARMGRLSIIAGVSAIAQDLPPFCVFHPSRRIDTLNLVGLRRKGLRGHIKPLQKAFDIVFREGHCNKMAARLIEQTLGDDPLCLELAAFVRDTRRGICPGPAA